jgi:serine/threonine protein kinase
LRENVRFLVLEIAEGGEFFDFAVAEKPFSIDIARYYFKKLIEAVEYLHS